MTVTALRALAALRDVLDQSGLVRTSKLNGGAMTGWIEPTHFGSTGFSIRPERDGSLNWHIVLSGKPHLRYRTYKQMEGDETVELHEPINPEALEGKLRAAFQEFGLDVKSVSFSGSQGMWDDDVEYDIVTERPAWLEQPDPRNRAPSGLSHPELVALVPARYGNIPAAPDRALVGYRQGAEIFLTRESIEACIVSLSISSRSPNDEVSLTDGVFKIRFQPFRWSQQAKTIRNHWGDEIEVWPAPANSVTVDPRFKPTIPFVMDGEMREGATLAEVDAQCGDDAPWVRAAPSSPKP